MSEIDENSINDQNYDLFRTYSFDFSKNIIMEMVSSELLTMLYSSKDLLDRHKLSDKQIIFEFERDQDPIVISVAWKSLLSILIMISKNCNSSHFLIVSLIRYLIRNKNNIVT